MSKYRAGSCGVDERCKKRRERKKTDHSRSDFVLFRTLFSRHNPARVATGRARGGMAGRTVVVRLNQQQLELIDRTIRRGEAADRVSLIRKALREQAGKQRGADAR
jgi:hypothetical protein